jgi:hypothetical protein
MELAFVNKTIQNRQNFFKINLILEKYRFFVQETAILKITYPLTILLHFLLVLNRETFLYHESKC